MFELAVPDLYINENKMQCGKNFKKAMFQVNLFIVFYDLNLNL